MNENYYSDRDYQYQRSGWIAGYINFIRNPNESGLLKMAPYAMGALLFGLIGPEIAVQFVPGLDFIVDGSEGIVASTAVFKTLRAISRNR